MPSALPKQSHSQSRDLMHHEDLGIQRDHWSPWEQGPLGTVWTSEPKHP